MAIPGTSDVQLSAPGAAKFTVLSMTDPNGNPSNVLDVDLGFTISGTVSLPQFLQGAAKVTVYADELGGPFDGPIGSVNLNLVPGPIPDPSGSETYTWSVTYNGASNILPDPSNGSQVYELAAVFVLGAAGLDIGAFVELGTFLIN